MSMCLRYALNFNKRSGVCALLTKKTGKLQRLVEVESRQLQYFQIRNSVTSSAAANVINAIKPTVVFYARKFSSSPIPPVEEQVEETADIMDLKNVVKRLNKFAPTDLAESWDNVGLLVEPTPPHQVNTLFLTNDLTEEVLEEAIKKESNMILSYHPPIFVPLKRLTMRSEKERIIVKAIEKRIAIYAPHTSYDAVQGGVNDWLASGLGKIFITGLVSIW